MGSGVVFLSGELPNPAATTQDVVGILCGILLIAGLWTPLTTTLAALDEVWIASTFSRSLDLPIWGHVFLAVLALSIAMLGPGAWSVDARLFGRRRIDVDRKRGRRPSL